MWYTRSLNLRPGIIRFSVWKAFFDPSKHKQNNLQVWIRLYNLPWEFWDKRLLSSIAHGIGVTIHFDHNNIEGEFGHYARILVDLDLFNPVMDQIRVDTSKKILWVSVEYENTKDFCTTCQSIGHSPPNYRRNQAQGGLSEKAKALGKQITTRDRSGNPGGKNLKTRKRILAREKEKRNFLGGSV